MLSRSSLRVKTLQSLSRSSSSLPSKGVPDHSPPPHLYPPTNVGPEPVPQAPNYPVPWSTNQRPRPAGKSVARFEQTDMSFQPNSLSAMELIAREPVTFVEGRKAVCDGGRGPLGHPKIYINLDKPGPKPCGYCGLRFEQAPHHKHSH